MKTLKLNKGSMKWQLFGYLTLFVGVLLILLWLFQVVFLNDFYKQIKVNEIKDVGKRIAKNLDHVPINDLMANIARSKELCIVLKEEDGYVIYAQDYLVNNKIYPMSYEDYYYLVQGARENGGTMIQYRPYGNLSIEKSLGTNYFRAKTQMTKMETVIYTQIIPRPNGKNYVLLINGVITPINATVQTIQKQLVYVTGIMLVMAFGLALLIAKKIAYPIAKMNEEAKGLAHKPEEVVFSDKGYREIQELSTTLNYAAKELARTENLRRELIANISHDLRTPLTLITGYAEVMRDLPGENTPENTQIIIDESKRLTRLVNDMLDLSKLQAGTQKLTLTTFNMTHSIQEILARYNALKEQEGYQIEFEYKEEVIIVADEIRFTQVFYNLVNNAIHYAGEDKKVTVKQLVKENYVRVEVIDTGAGIAKEDLPYIWDRYYKVDKNHKQTTIGSGLGLSIVRSILESHEGKYGVLSEVGQGSTFWFELKRHDG